MMFDFLLCQCQPTVRQNATNGGKITLTLGVSGCPQKPCNGHMYRVIMELDNLC